MPGSRLALVVLATLVVGCRSNAPSNCGLRTPRLDDGASTDVTVDIGRDGRMSVVSVDGGIYGPVEVQRDLVLITPELPPDVDGETRPGRVTRTGDALSLEVAGQTVRLTRYFCD